MPCSVDIFIEMSPKQLEGHGKEGKDAEAKSGSELKPEKRSEVKAAGSEDVREEIIALKALFKKMEESKGKRMFRALKELANQALMMLEAIPSKKIF